MDSFSPTYQVGLAVQSSKKLESWTLFQRYEDIFGRDQEFFQFLGNDFKFCLKFNRLQLELTTIEEV